MRGQLEEDKTVQQNVTDRGDTVLMYGKPRHVLGYLGDFLFSPQRARSPVSILSGGERNRLLLAKLFVHEANLLILDEPTNDLDTDTLELLETTLLGYQGTLILVSHDREFLNNVVTSCIAFDEDGVVRHYAGGYDDWLAQRPKTAPSPSGNTAVAAPSPSPSKPAQSVKNVKKRSYKEKRELEQVPAQLELLEQEQAELNQELSKPDFFGGPRDEVQRVTDRLSELESQLTRLMERWEELEERSGGE